MAQLAATLALAATAAAGITGAVAAQARTPAPGRTATVSCPAKTICAFSGASATGTEKKFATSAHHSSWDSFKSAAGFNPKSVIDNSGSDIWVYDQAAARAHHPKAGPYCAFGTSLRNYTFTGYTPSFFFIQFNKNTCATAAPAPPS